MPIQLNSDEFSKLFFRFGRGKTNPVFKALINLKVGEALKIERAEWKKRYHVSRMIGYIRRHYHYEFTGGRLADGTGWAYKREK